MFVLSCMPTCSGILCVHHQSNMIQKGSGISLDCSTNLSDHLIWAFDQNLLRPPITISHVIQKPLNKRIINYQELNKDQTTFFLLLLLNLFILLDAHNLLLVVFFLFSNKDRQNVRMTVKFQYTAQIIIKTTHNLYHNTN